MISILMYMVNRVMSLFIWLCVIVFGAELIQHGLAKDVALTFIFTLLGLAYEFVSIIIAYDIYKELIQEK